MIFIIIKIVFTCFKNHVTILPLESVGEGESPYAFFSSSAQNTPSQVLSKVFAWLSVFSIAV